LKKGALFFFLGCMALGYLASRVGVYSLNDKFLLSHITLKNSPSTTSLVNEELPKTLSRPFFYLDQGSQMYAFKSEDGEYVLKLIKQHRLAFFKIPSSHLLASFLQEIQREKEEEKLNKRLRLYESCKIAWNELRNECGLVYLGICPKHNIPIPLTLYDKLGRKHTLLLDSTEFILQKKGELIAPTLNKLISKGDIEGAKKRLDQLFSLLLLRCQKGIFDSDAFISKNAGFIEDRAIYLDLGGFSKNGRMQNPRIYILEIEKISSKLRLWLNGQNQELANYSTDLINQLQ